MRHKYLIWGLSAVLVVLIIAKVCEPTQFPIRIDYNDYAYSSGEEYKVARRLKPLLKLRMKQSFSDIPWDGFSIGDYAASVSINSKNTTDSTIILNGATIDARVYKFFSPSDKLIEIDLYFRNEQQITTDILSVYGEHYLTVHEYNYERYFWIKDSTLVIYEIDKIDTPDSGHLTIADISDFSEAELNKFIRYGHISHHSVQDPIIQSYLELYRTSRSYTPSTTTKKYGDSDTYQGSSKQKEDLEAIDRYFGL